MFELMQAIPFSFAALFPVLNPLGSALIFLMFTQSLPEPAIRKLAFKVAINTFILLAVVLLTGSWILRFFGITIPIVQIGGGLVVAYIGWSLLNQNSTSGNNSPVAATNEQEANSLAFFPLTMPITAGPGCIAVTLTIGAHELSRNMTTALLGELGAVIGIILSAITVFFCYRYADKLTNKLGVSGKQVIMRLSAFINLCIGLEIIWHGVQGLLR